MQVPKETPQVAKRSVAAVKHHWLTISFVLGFIIDNLTLNRVDQLFDNLVLFSYVVLATIGLLLLYAGAAAKLSERWIPRARKYAPMLVQYAFGGLLSGMLIFYGRSGAWAESWPFLLIILLIIYGNETIKDRAGRLIFNLSVYFIVLFSWVVLVIPVFTGVMGPWVFVGSGLVAVFLMYWFIQALARIVPNFMMLQMRKIVFVLGSIYATMNILYFTNVIPPIPLSLKDVGIYHSVVRFENGDYQLKYEDGSWWQFFKNSDDTFHARSGENIFCFAKVFAPTKLETDIYHTWQYYNERTETWETKSWISYRISGGRDGGYRGYTQIRNYQDGTWRCSVETERGQVLGREEFEIDSTQAPSELVTITE